MCIIQVCVSCIHVIRVCLCVCVCACVCVRVCVRHMHITHILCNILYAYISLSFLAGACTKNIHAAC